MHIDISKLIIESGLINYALLDEELTIIECNNGFAKFFHDDIGNIKNTSIKKYLLANEAEKLVTFLTKQVSAKVPKTITLNFTTNANETSLVLSVIACIDNRKLYIIQASELKIIIESVNDKHQLHNILPNKQLIDVIQLNEKLENQLKDYEILYNKIITSEYINNKIINSLNDGVWMWNLAINQVTFSERFFAMLNYESYELPQEFNTIRELLHPDEISIINESISDLKNKKYESVEQECRLRKKNGDYIYTLLRAKLIESNEINIPPLLIATHVDIDKHKRLELKLRENELELLKKNEEYLQINKKLEKSIKENEKLIKELKDNQIYLNSIVKAVPAVVALVSNQTILYVNDYACLMTGYERDEVIGKDIQFLFPDMDEFNRVIKLLAREIHLSDNEIQSKSIVTKWKTKNGVLIDVYLTVAFIDSEVLPNSYTVAAIDITSQRIYEEELLKAKELAEKAEMLKTRFLCNISHELRTPANGIIGFAELLQKQIAPAKSEQYLKIIINSSKQLVKTISDLIDISKIEIGEIEIFETKVDITQLIKKMYEQYFNILLSRNKIDVEISPIVNLPEKHWNIITDNNKLEKVLNNLLNNAVKFTDKGYIRFGVSENDNKLQFFVSDTGIGMEEEELKNVFESFRRTEFTTRNLYGGNGLGLAISKGFIESMGGEIWIQSSKGIGTTVFFTLPLKVASQPYEKKRSMQKKWENFKLLIVEDDIITVELIKNILEDTGIQITHASTGLEAMKLMKRNFVPDIILMDMRLPEMDGYETTKRIKEIDKTIPIIAQTAHALTEDRNKCLSAGCDEYLTKPFSEETLIRMLSNFLKK